MKNKFVIKGKALIIFFFLTSIMTVTIYAQEMAIPANVQANVFKKIFAFDKTLTSKGNIEVAVLAGSGSADVMVNAFKAVGINAKAASGDQIPAGASVVYLMPGVTPQTQLYASKGILSICGTSIDVEDGKVAIGLGLENDKAKIIVNIKQLKAAGHELSTEVLKLADIIK